MAPALLDREPIAPGDDEERRALSEIHEQFRVASRVGAVRLVGPQGESIQIPPSLFRALQVAVDVLARGEAVVIMPVHRELTTQQAADILNVSRQYLVRLLDAGKIPFTRAGTHRRVKFGDLRTYLEQRDAQRQRNLDDLTQLSQELGLYG